MKKIAVCLILIPSLGGLLLAQNGYMGHRINNNLVFPHFVLAEGFTTELIVMNPSPGNSVTGDLLFFRQDGTPLTIVSNSQQVSQIPLTIPAGGVSFVKVGAITDDLTIGWALLDAAANDATSAGDALRKRLFGSVVFTRQSGGTTTGKVGVVTGRYQPGDQRRLALPVITSASVNTGVAVLNAGSAPLNLTFQLTGPAGTVFQDAATPTPSISPLPAGHQRAIFVTELFPTANLADFRGTLTIQADGEGLVVAGLLTDQELLSSIPVARVPRTEPATFTVRNQGFNFVPDSLDIQPGDTVTWVLDNIHNVVEVTKETFDAQGNTPRPGGFSLPFGGGSVTFNNEGDFYYVCSPHASLGMRGKITVSRDNNPN